MAKNSFSVQIDPIAAPVSPNGNLLIAAGQQEGKAAATKGVADATGELHKANTLAFLGTQAVEAVKGKMVADQEEEVNDILSKLEGNVESRIDANNKKLAGQFMDSAESDDFSGATLGHFTEEASKFALAQRQGVIPRDEAITKIGEVVKRYSAMLPGFASDFRKKAAELTGISNIDVAGVHAMLTKKTASEKAAEAQAAARVQLDKELAGALGIQLDQITPNARAFYASTKQLGLMQQQAEARRKMVDMRRDEVDQFHNDGVSVDLATAVAGIAAQFSQLHAKHMESNTPLKRDEALKLGGQLAGQLDVLEAQLVARINARTIGKNPMRREEAEKRITALRASFGSWKEAVKTSEGFNVWQQAVKSSEGDANMLMNKITLANPYMAALGKWQVAQPFAQAYLTLGKDKFSQMHGTKVADALERALSEPQSYFGALDRVLSGTTDLAQEPDPNHRRVIYNELVGQLEGLVKDADILSDPQRQAVKNGTRNWLDNLDPTNPADLAKFTKLMTGPNAAKLWKDMLPLERAEALSPLFNRLGQQVLPSTIADVKTLVAGINDGAGNKQAGHRVEVRLNPLTNRFEAEVIAAPSPNRPSMDNPVTAITTGFVRPNSRPEEREKMDVLKQRLDILNSVPRALTQLTPLVNDQAKPELGNMLRQLHASITTDKPIDVVAHVLGATGPDTDQNDRRLARQDVPRNPGVATVVDDTVLDALGFAESGNNPEAVGDKGKAVGEFQMWEGAMADAGFDPEDRKDPVKSRQAAKTYLEMQLKMFDGDMTKALAAWNMGPGRFRSHLREHGDSWMQALPQATKTLLKRFNSQLQGG